MSIRDFIIEKLIKPKPENYPYTYRFSSGQLMLDKASDMITLEKETVGWLGENISGPFYMDLTEPDYMFYGSLKAIKFLRKSDFISFKMYME